MIDVLHVMASGARAGGADHVRRLLADLRAAGLACALAVSDDGPLAVDAAGDGFEVFVLPMMRSRLDVLAPWRLSRLIARVAPRLVHWHGTRAAFFGAVSQSVGAPRIPSVYTAHGLSYRRVASMLHRQLFLRAERLACARASAVICVAAADATDLRERGFVAPERIRHVPNGIDLEVFAPRSQEAARQRLGVSVTARVVGTVARLVPEKAIEVSVAAMREVPDASLIVIGDGPERERLETQAQRLGLRVRFLGERADVAQVLPAFDVFVLSSLWEGEPVAVLEAMACGLPVVASATSGAKELVREGQTGHVVPIGDAAALGKAVARLLASAEVRQRMGAAGRTAVAERSYASTARGVMAVYDSVVHPRATCHKAPL